ncbi:hypothetical protein SBF1_1280005 [Candidatus Desulfosporosinus infrequens]|uniref:HPt domain-containing protein n=1 Tax=Candidatus Desulfosporosinus infrequens TaxID=2043169 RepID=A0A2U3K399_9FIRM|nr:hypothetical protein SBF1_1280005 [Candidatus Desulfosporosinus infrequens]
MRIKRDNTHSHYLLQCTSLECKKVLLAEDDLVSRNIILHADHVRKASAGVERSSAFEDTVTTLMAATGFDRETSESFIAEFCEHSLKLISSIKKYLQENNPKDAGLLLHRLKGSSGNVRAKEIAMLALKAEEALRLEDSRTLDRLLQSIENSLDGLM